MLDDLRELYQEVILDHCRDPRNHRNPPDANRHAHGDNPVCCDSLIVYATVDDTGLILDVAFEGSGCAISVASASLMTETLKGKTEVEAKEIFECFHEMCMKGGDLDDEELGSLQVLAGVHQFPMRVKCATLAWHTFNAAMSGDNDITTE